MNIIIPTTFGAKEKQWYPLFLEKQFQKVFGDETPLCVGPSEVTWPAKGKKKNNSTRYMFGS